MRHFTVTAPLTIRGRAFKGLRGYAGKPFHPPLTDVPITAYLFGVVFDILSVALYSGHRELATELFRAGTWVFLGGVGVSVLAALTGWADWYRSSEAGTQARRTINTHAIIMITVTLFALADLGLRLAKNDAASTPNAVLALSIVAAGLVMLGATYGGSMVYDYGFNIETAGDHPVWHKSEVDVRHGEKRAPEAPPAAVD